MRTPFLPHRSPFQLLPLFGLAATLSASGCAGDGANPDPGGGADDPYPGFRVQGRDLYDRCGEKVILRGVNEMVVWSSGKDGVPEFAEIAKTGANVVRIVWTAKDGSPAELDQAIGNAVAAQLIPMIELHDATGDNSKIPMVVDWWVKPEVVAVIKKWQHVLLVNIANEAGAGTVNAAIFEEDYTLAVTRMREAGYHVPLILDAPNWGQNLNILLAGGPAVLAADPDQNLMLSVHMWWNDPDGARVIKGIADSVASGLPIVIGEFAHHAAYQCTAAPFDYRTMMAEAQANGIGWLVWSWGGVKNNDCAADGPFDMTTDGTFAGLVPGWATEIAVSDPNSIQNTSVRPASMVNGTCM
jgi:mannan endo-1,4-beta-mannosidase